MEVNRRAVPVPKAKVTITGIKPYRRTDCDVRPTTSYQREKKRHSMDLSIRMAGIDSKNPILPGASELAFDDKSAEMVAKTGVGGIVPAAL